jgi:hypothetical protein
MSECEEGLLGVLNCFLPPVEIGLERRQSPDYRWQIRVASCDELEGLSQGKWEGRGEGNESLHVLGKETGSLNVRKELPSRFPYFPSFLCPHRQPARGRMSCLKEEEIKTAFK